VQASWTASLGGGRTISVSMPMVSYAPIEVIRRRSGTDGAGR
jgi:hypothetical protein